MRFHRKILPLLALWMAIAGTPVLAQDDSSVHVVPFGFGNPEEALEQAKTFLSPGGHVTVNSRNNTLIVIDSPEVARRIEEYFQELPPPQNVRIDVEVFEGNAASPEIVGIPLGARDTMQTQDIHLTVSSGSQATIQVGERVAQPAFFYHYFLTRGLIVEGIEWQDVGSKLEVLPRVSGDQAEITVTPVVSYYSDGKHRSIAVRELATQVLAINGQWLEIGGAMQDSEFSTIFFRNRFNRPVRFRMLVRW